MKKKNIPNKEEICEDWCFGCKDGGLLYVCDYKQCLKAYHAHCAGKDESFFVSGNRWSCRWHSCLICQKNSKLRCFCCPNAVCKRCIINAEFARVRGEKGFCNHCLKLALLSEENMDVDSDGEKVDFKDRETYEGLFMEYWEIIKKQEGLTLEHLRLANAQLKKGENFKPLSYLGQYDEEDSQLRSDYENEDGMEEPKEVKKKSKGQQLVMKKKEVVSNKMPFIGWGSKSLIDFLASIGKDTSKELSQFEVHNIITGYINENSLFHSERRKKILCDERLKSVLGRKTVNRNKIHDLLEPHFIGNLEPSEDDFEYNSEAEDENVLVVCKKQKLTSSRKTQEKEVFSAPQSCFASITSENIKLVYLRRSLVQELLKEPETFESKVIGSFVRVKSEFIDFTQKSSHQLVEVTGIKRTALKEMETEIVLQVSNISIGISIDMLSDDNFSEEECEYLKQKVEGGLLRKFTIVELKHKSRSLHKDITNHWIDRELALLQNLIDRANEKGWRRELFEYMERKQLLHTPQEKSRLLEMVPTVIADVARVEPMPDNAIKESKHEVERSPKSILVGSSETCADDWGGSGIYSVAKANEQNGCASTPEVKQSLAAQTYILEEKPCQISTEQKEKHSKFSTIVDQPSTSEKQKQSNDSEQKSIRIQEEPGDRLIELSSDDDENDDSDIAIGNQRLEGQMWNCLGPNKEKKGPLSNQLLKRWSETSSFALKFKVWKTGESEENAISLGDAVQQISNEN